MSGRRQGEKGRGEATPIVNPMILGHPERLLSSGKKGLEKEKESACKDQRGKKSGGFSRSRGRKREGKVTGVRGRGRAVSFQKGGRSKFPCATEDCRSDCHKGSESARFLKREERRVPTGRGAPRMRRRRGLPVSLVGGKPKVAWCVF